MASQLSPPLNATGLKSHLLSSARSHSGVVLLAVLLPLLFFHQLASRDLWGSHEARAGQNAASMLHYRDWSMPRLTDERLDLQKPPLYYWLVAAVAMIRGGEVDAWSIRLPAAIAATLTVLLVYFVLARRGRPAAALLAAIVLATAQHFTWLARTARIDMPLTLCVAVAVLTIGASRRWHVIGYLAIAAALLLKGPIGLVLQVAVILGNAVLARASRCDCPSIRSLLWGIPLSIAIAAPWFVWATVKTDGEFFRVFFWYHNVERAMGSAEELAIHPWWYYGPRLLVDALPWSLLVLPAMVWLVRGRSREDREARLGAVWLFAVVGVLSFAQFKRADYLLPAYPGLAILVGCAGERFLLAAPAIRRALVVGLGITLIGIVATWTWLIHVEHPRLEPFRECRTFARRIREVAPDPAPVLFFRVESHALAFHLGRPINTLLEWENLDVWAGKTESHYVLMPPDASAEWKQHIASGTLEEVFRNTDFCGGAHEKPVVLMRTRPVKRATMPHPENKPTVAHRPISMALPVRNQATILDRALPAWVAALAKLDRPFEILVVDDGSSDETVRRARIVASSHPEVQVFQLGQTQGYGAALRMAIDKAQYPLFFYTALDYPYQTSDLRKLLDRIDDVDFVSGYRTAVPPPKWVANSRRYLDIALRVLIGLKREPQPGWLGWKLHCYAHFVRIFFGVQLVDVESAYKLFRREVVAAIPIQSDGPFIHTEIVAKSNFRGCWMDELPIGAQGGVPREALAIPFHVRDRRKDLKRVLFRPTFVKPAAESPPADETSPAPSPAAI